MREDASGRAALFCLAFDDGFEVCALPYCCFFLLFCWGRMDEGGERGSFCACWEMSARCARFSYEYVIWGCSSEKRGQDSSFRRRIIYDICDWIRVSLPNPTFFFFTPRFMCLGMFEVAFLQRACAARRSGERTLGSTHTGTQPGSRMPLPSNQMSYSDSFFFLNWSSGLQMHCAACVHKISLYDLRLPSLENASNISVRVGSHGHVLQHSPQFKLLLSPLRLSTSSARFLNAIKLVS